MRGASWPFSPAPRRRVAQRVTVTLERLDPTHQGETETVSARYVVGCDGARSIVRTSIGRELRGDAANHAWGVMDVLAVTDFPDIRCKSLIQSAMRAASSSSREKADTSSASMSSWRNSTSASGSQAAIPPSTI